MDDTANMVEPMRQLEVPLAGRAKNRWDSFCALAGRGRKIMELLL